MADTYHIRRRPCGGSVLESKKGRGVEVGGLWTLDDGIQAGGGCEECCEVVSDGGGQVE